jgi:lactate dehydrogenase-like 2-hydroxyacid dehydrogenase
MDVLVGGERFDALQVGVRVLWEIKTHRFDTYNAYIQGQEIDKELKQLRKERAAARACGYDFVVGVSTQAHKDALLALEPSLKIVVTGCKR